ncbi:hypothetical protein AVEN_21735-1 [Araneus ventricosus]|uniref:Uncharacterized protein n=1 Tax=Araneus ventricosus TaxID=182803 RepID=A0A4Y2EUD1_ARAVE|nr:hypothetical protein AVEN_21735-1 [Araneus ventricosus]
MEFLLSPTHENCSETMGDKEKEAWDSFKDVMHRVLENTKDPPYKTIVQRMLTVYEAQECKMSFKVHFLHSHIVKSKVKDFTRMSVISRDDTKEGGTSTCSMITVECSGGKQKIVSESVF